MNGIVKCPVVGCGKICTDSSILGDHLKTVHSTLNKFECSVCGKRLASRQNLKEHNYIHTGEKPYKCSEPYCDATFRQGTHLSAHRRMVHSYSSTIYVDNLSSRDTIGLKFLTSLLNRKDLNLYSSSKQTYSEEPSINLPPIKGQLPNIFQNN